jgi:hypothetical protein
MRKQIVDPFKIRSSRKNRTKVVQAKTKKPVIQTDYIGLILKARKLLKQLEAVKPLYKELDAITEVLQSLGFSDAHGIAMVDNFAAKNVVWKSSAMRRFELKIVGGVK